MRLLRRQTAFVIASVALAAAAGGSATGSTAASVADVEYSQSALKSDLADAIVDGTAPAASTNQWLNEWIFFTAIGLELEDRGVVPTDAQVVTAITELQTRDPEFYNWLQSLETAAEILKNKAWVILSTDQPVIDALLGQTLPTQEKTKARDSSSR